MKENIQTEKKILQTERWKSVKQFMKRKKTIDYLNFFFEFFSFFDQIDTL